MKAAVTLSISSVVRPVAERESLSALRRFVCFSLAVSSAVVIVSTAEAVSVAELLTSSPVVDATIPKPDSVSASFCTSPLEVSEINPHSTAASTNALTWSLPFSTPSVSNVYLKSVSVSPRSFRASAFFLTSFPNLEVSFPDIASLNLFAETADSFN